jgi:hypothetical protein
VTAHATTSPRRHHSRRPLRLRLSALVIVTAAAALALTAASCSVDRAKFNRRIFACDTAAPDPGCGTDDNGQPMACFAARQIGATDFCAKRCDAPLSTADGEVCLASQIDLRLCHPSEDVTIRPGAACDQPDLACYRTDLLSDEGVCTTLNPCTEDVDCRDPVRSVCATSFLSTTIYPEAGAALQLDHLFCLQTGCQARGTSCSPGETCLQDVIPLAAHPPDICVPNCDSNLRCPPNFLCYKKVSTSVAPNVCIPGLLGFTCENAIDCMIGTCVDTGIGYSVCTTACDSDADCQRFDGQQGRFICVKNNAAPTEPGLCQTPTAYLGSICHTTSDCLARNPDEICTQPDPKDPQRVCLLPCSLPDLKCPQRGGVNHTCIPSDDPNAPVCVPGTFGLPCASDGNCVGDLTCQPTFPSAPDICTAPCQTDADCASSSAGGKGNRWVAGDGFCGAPLGNPVCLPNNILPDGSPCTSDIQCDSKKCTSGMCAPLSR